MSSGQPISSEAYGGYFWLSTIALSCYEYLLTFDAELKYVWRRRVSTGSVLFVLNRYAVLVGSFAGVVQALPGLTVDTGPVRSDLESYLTICQISTWISSVCFSLVSCSYTAFAVLRMYALYEKKKTVSIIVLVVGIIGPCVQCIIVREVTRRPEDDLIALQRGVINCRSLVLKTSFFPRDSPGVLSVDIYFYLVLRLHSLLFEMLLLGMTWNKTLTSSNLRTPAFRAPFTTVLLRDGTLYFIAIAIVAGFNLGGIAAAIRLTATDIVPSPGRPTDSDFVFALVLSSSLVDVMTSVCMSRFVLNLLAAADGDYDTRYRSSHWNAVLRFAQIEALGAPLRDTSDGNSDNENCVFNNPHLDDVDTMQANGVQ